MKKIVSLIVVAACVATVSSVAQARVSVDIGLGVPGYYAPPPVVYAPPVYVAPQPVYAGPPVYVAPPVVYGYGPRPYYRGYDHGYYHGYHHDPYYRRY